MNRTEKELYGPLMIDIAGLQLTNRDRERLLHPLVGGLILFSRNFESLQQLNSLAEEVHSLKSPPLLIAIDHEGGRVQRCREGFTRLPAMRSLGTLWDQDPEKAISDARSIGFVLAAELRRCGIDFSFTPVLDLDWGRSSVVGNRAFHGNPVAVVALAGALIEGLHHAGMRSCGKHFPGHGWADADSHVSIPIDERNLEALEPDMIPYRELSLDAVMPAHVIYSSIDSNTSCFSKYWNRYLRKVIKFDGVILSDDLSMEGASVAGDIVARVGAAWGAGCDLLLICNAPQSVDKVLVRWKPELDPVRSTRIARMVPKELPPPLEGNPLYLSGVEASLRLG